MVPTVSTAPTRITLKLKVCCVVRAAFSMGDKLPQATLPSSLKAVTAFLRGCDAAFEVPRPVCVAYKRAAIMGRRAAGKDRRGVARVKEFMMKDRSVDV